MNPELQSALLAFLTIMSPVVAGAIGLILSRQGETNRAQKIINDQVVTEREARLKLEIERAIQAQELVRLNGLITKNAERIAETQAALETAYSENSGLKAKLEATGKELETTKATLNARLSEVMASLDKINTDYSEMQRKYATMEIEREQIEKELRDKTAALELENTQHQNRIKELETELEVVRNQLTNTEAERDLVQARLSEIETEKVTLEGQMRDRDAIIAQLRTELDALRARADVSEIAVDKLTDDAHPSATLPQDED
jgi:chromosome segregation ATPase